MVRLMARKLLALAGLTVLGLTGCAGTYDLVTSQRFRERPFHTIFSSEDPMEVLVSVEEGDERVRAMRDVREPKKHGGTEADQEKLIAILQTSATADRRPFCRLAAVETLSRFEDPRANGILIAAYRSAAKDSPAEAGSITTVGFKTGGGSFTPESVTAIQCRVLESLGKLKQPEGLQLLCEVARVRCCA